MNRSIRTLTFLNSSESKRFYSNHRRFPPPVFNRQTSRRPILNHKPPPSSAVPGRLAPARIDSDRLEASRFEDFARVHGGVVSSHSEASDESVVEEREPDEVNEEGQSQSYKRKVLPEELSKNVLTLTCESSAEGGICDVYVVGTSHVSTESCQEVKAVIKFLKPQVVFLELCSGRVVALTAHKLKVPTVEKMMDMWKKNHNPFGILYSWFLATAANQLEVVPGAEFRVAYEEAVKYGGKVILGDRPVQITLRRTWAKMPLWHKTKFFFPMFFGTLFSSLYSSKPEDLKKMLKEMEDVDVLTLVIQEMSKKFPTLWTTLVHERDLGAFVDFSDEENFLKQFLISIYRYMSSTLLRAASESNSVVAVVGKGHLAGIKKHWKQPIELKELLTIPSEKPAISVKRILSSLGVAVAGVAIISGIYTSIKK